MTELSSSQILDAVRRGLDLVSTRFSGESKEILVVGVSHEGCQIRPESAPADNAEALKAELTQFVRQREPGAIAEEMNLEALKDRQTVGQEIARTYGLVHRLCDPTSSEREAIGIGRNDSAADGQKRESEWARRLTKMSASRILFLCGANHVMSFAKLCRDLGWTAEILCEDFHAPHVPLDRRVI